MRLGELTTEQREKIDKVSKVDDEMAIEEFIKSRRMKNVRESTIKYYYDSFHVLKRDLQRLDIHKQLVELKEEDIEKIILEKSNNY